MTWTAIARREHNRDALRFPSDLTNREWALIAPLIPEAKHGGRPRTTNMRSVVEAILSIASSGCQWRMLPGDFPPVSTVRDYFHAWRGIGLRESDIEGREAQPTAGVIDSQSVKTTESGGICGYDAGKKIKGRKRHIVTDTLGFLIFVLIHAADIQDRDGAPSVSKAIRRRFPRLRHIFADGGYAGARLRQAMRGHGDWMIEIVKRSDQARGSSSCPGDGWVERTFAWLDAAFALPRTGKNRSKAQPHGRKSPQFACSQAASQDIAYTNELLSRAP